jgi:hypothetical protein
MKVALLVLVLALPGVSWSQACCTGTGAGEFGVVGRCQQGVLATLLSYTSALASYDSEGVRHPVDHADVRDLVWMVGGGWRLTRRWQIHGSVPLRHQSRDFRGMASDTAIGLGDASVGTRYMLMEDPMLGLSDNWRPFLDVYAIAALPTGRPPEETEHPAGADISGTGRYTFSTGLRITKFVTPAQALMVSGSLGMSPERTIELPTRDRTFAAGPVVNAHLMYLHIFSLWWSAGAHLTGQWTGDAAEDGQTLVDSGTSRYRMGLHVTHALSLPFWEVTAAAWVDPWWDGGARNQPFMGPTGSLSVQRNFL